MSAPGRMKRSSHSERRNGGMEGWTARATGQRWAQEPKSEGQSEVCVETYTAPM